MARKLPVQHPEIDKLQPDSTLSKLYRDLKENSEKAVNATDGDSRPIDEEALLEWTQLGRMDDYRDVMMSNSAYLMAVAIWNAIQNELEGGRYFSGYYFNGSFYRVYDPAPETGGYQYLNPYSPREGKLYVDVRGGIYIWNKEQNTYISLSGGQSSNSSSGSGGTVAQTIYDLVIKKNGVQVGQTYNPAQKAQIIDIQDVASAESLIRLIADLSNVGSHDLPVYLTSNGRAITIDALKVPGDIESTDGDVKSAGDVMAERNVQAKGGVSAEGIADLVQISGGGGGGGSVNGVRIGDGTAIGPDAEGIVPLPPYPVTPSQSQMDAWDAKYKKPSPGIPKTDLSSGVQETLEQTENNTRRLDSVESDMEDVQSELIQKVDKSDLQSKGAHNLPVYFDLNSRPQVIDSIDVPGDISSGSDISADGGVSAKGIADLSTSGGGGGEGTVKGVKVGPTGNVNEPDPITGVVEIPEYPDEPTQQQINYWNNKVDVSDLAPIQQTIEGLDDALSDHKNDKNNPHEVTKSQVGLGNVDNTSDLSKPVSTATQTELNKKVDKTSLVGKGSAVLPIYFDNSGEAQEVNGIDVPNNVQAGGGVSAQGITDLAQVTGGGGLVNGVRIGEGTAIGPDAEGIVPLPVYPTWNAIKPQGGIAKGDLDIDVQNSLEKADSAVQQEDLARVASTGDYNDLTNKPQVVTYDNLDVTEAESTGKIATARSVAILKDHINVESLDSYDPKRDYNRGESVKIWEINRWVGYRFKVDHAHTESSLAGHIERLTYKTLAHPCELLASEIDLICI